MTAETVLNTTKTFKYSFPTCTNEELLYKLEVPVTIPHGGSTRELVQRVINMFHIPVYLEDELNEKLAEFVSTETKNFHNERDEKLLNQLKNSELNVEGIVKNWEKMFKDNVLEFAEQKGVPDEEVFAATYHKLVHSPMLESILQVENSYAKTVMTTLKNRDDDIRMLTQRQTEEMEEQIRLLNTSTTEEAINALAAAQFEAQALAAARWGSQLEALKQAQRAHHRAWLVSALHRASEPTAAPEDSPLATFSEPPSLGRPAPKPERLEESFTIHLGSQLKQTHNVRIVAMDMLELCHLDHMDPAEASRRLQTSLSLYSGELSACVLLCEAPPDRPAPPTTSLIAAAQCSTEHHFPDVEAQFQEIMERIKEPASRRNAVRMKEHSEAGGRPTGRWRRALQPGDVLVTKHSNLAEVHVVFHLYADDAQLRTGDITSRHPAILGLRNILKAACCNDITTIAIPLLLCHELAEECTAAWCLRRAELVLKCAKGFALEAAGWGGAEPRTLTATAPIAPSATPLFHQLAALLPAVFRLSNPVRARPAQE